MTTESKWIVRVIPVAAAALVLAAGMSFAGDMAMPDGAAIYKAKCAMCHGADGVAKEMWAKKGMKNFNDAMWQKSMSDEAITKDITEGIVEKKMPSYKDKLKTEEIAAVVKYLRTLAPAK